MGMGIHHSDQAVRTLGGTLIAFIDILDGSDLLKTGILACVGAMVSFGVSKGLHRWWPGEKTHPGLPLQGKERNDGHDPEDE